MAINTEHVLRLLISSFFPFLDSYDCSRSLWIDYSSRHRIASHCVRKESIASSQPRHDPLTIPVSVSPPLHFSSSQIYQPLPLANTWAKQTSLASLTCFCTVILSTGRDFQFVSLHIYIFPFSSHLVFPSTGIESASCILSHYLSFLFVSCSHVFIPLR